MEQARRIVLYGTGRTELRKETMKTIEEVFGNKPVIIWLVEEGTDEVYQILLKEAMNK